MNLCLKLTFSLRFVNSINGNFKMNLHLKLTLGLIFVNSINENFKVNIRFIKFILNED